MMSGNGASDPDGHPDSAGTHDSLAFDLPSDVEAPARARRRLSQAASGLPAELIARARLALSELVTNAVRHGSGARIRVHVDVVHEDDRLTLTVSDEGLSEEQQDGESDPGPVGGYGLHIVDHVSERWTADTGDAWTVTAEFTPRQSSLAVCEEST